MRSTMVLRECIQCHNFIRLYDLLFEMYLILLAQHEGCESDMIAKSDRPDVLRKVRDLIHEHRDATNE